MKVIIIKDCKDGKTNQVIDVLAGYATNYLIKNKFAVAYNSSTAKILDHKLSDLQAIEHEKRQEALEIKKQLEDLPNLKFKLKTNIDANQNLIVHGSISAKNILQEINNQGVKVTKSQIESHNIKTLGHHDIVIQIYKDISAKIIVEVSSHE